MSEFQTNLLAALALQATAMSIPGQNHFLILSALHQGALVRGIIVYLGGKLIYTALRRHPPKNEIIAPNLSLSRAFFLGFFVNISNAKSVLFFGAVFATTLPLSTMSLGDLVFVVLSFFLNSIFFHGAVSALLSLGAIRRFTKRQRPIILLVSGCLFLLFAVFSTLHFIETWFMK